jgi:hypothetical protein
MYAFLLPTQMQPDSAVEGLLINLVADDDGVVKLSLAVQI